MFLSTVSWNNCVVGKCLCKRFKKTWTISVLTFIEYGGLNQINLRLRLRLSLACRSDGVWGIKREGNENFDVPMGCFDAAEVCELVATYMLRQLNTVFENLSSVNNTTKTIHQKTIHTRTIFKVNNKNPETKSLTLFWCRYC